jgi:hypothetical protein
MRSTTINMTVSSLTHEVAFRGLLCVIAALREAVCFVVPGKLARIGRYSCLCGSTKDRDTARGFRVHGETICCDAVMVRWY